MASVADAFGDDVHYLPPRYIDGTTDPRGSADAEDGNRASMLMIDARFTVADSMVDGQILFAAEPEVFVKMREGVQPQLQVS
jgi:hypothetical protein